MRKRTPIICVEKIEWNEINEMGEGFLCEKRLSFAENPLDLEGSKALMSPGMCEDARVRIGRNVKITNVFPCGNEKYHIFVEVFGYPVTS